MVTASGAAPGSSTRLVPTWSCIRCLVAQNKRGVAREFTNRRLAGGSVFKLSHGRWLREAPRFCVQLAPRMRSATPDESRSERMRHDVQSPGLGLNLRKVTGAHDSIINSVARSPLKKELWRSAGARRPAKTTILRTMVLKARYPVTVRTFGAKRPRITLSAANMGSHTRRKH